MRWWSIFRKANAQSACSPLVVVGLAMVSIGFFVLLIYGLTRMISQVTDKFGPSDMVRRGWDSGLFADPNEGARSIFWVDDTTVLFAANKDPKPQTPEQMNARIHLLYLWTLGELPRPVGGDAHFAANNGYCAAGGRILYHQSAVDPTTGKAVVISWSGPPGSEKEAGPRKYSDHEKGVPRNLSRFIEPSDCSIFADPAMDGQDYVTDSERRFYLVYGPSKSSPHVTGQLVLMKANGSERKILPFIGNVTYRRFDRAFYIWESSIANSKEQGYPPFINSFELWRESNCWPIWRVEPESDGIRRICLPYGSWAGNDSNGSIDLLPTKAGLFFAFRRTLGPRGLYKLEGQSVRQVVEGDVRAAVVSPNGCRIAFQHVPSESVYRIPSPITSTIVAIDICDTKE